MEWNSETVLPETVPEIGDLCDSLSDQVDSALTDFRSLNIDKPAVVPMALNSKIIQISHGSHPDQLLHHSLPITCLKLLDEIILIAAEGPSILMKMAYFDNQPFQRFQLFPSQFVISRMEFHRQPELECGDCPNERYTNTNKSYAHFYIGYVWAGNLGTLVRITRSTKGELKLLDYSGCNDFFSLDFIPVAAKWLEGGNCLALLSVLNYLVLFERTGTPETPEIFTKLTEVTRIKCSKSETLFSGKIVGEIRTDIQIFSGTVFNGIIVWNVKGSDACIKHELRCHDGIVFSLEYYADRRLLLSTSDDRTVAVWQFSNENDGQETVKLLNRLYGHDARVWKAMTIHGYILSVGESSDVRVNILKDGTEHKTWKAHENSPIFTCVYDKDLEILYTGGNDGSIRKWPKWWYRSKPRALPYDVVQFQNETGQSGRASENKDFPKTIAFLDINHVIVSMESGRILGMNWEGEQFDLLHDPRCKGFQIIRISPDHKTLAVAGNNGHFYTAQISFSENRSSKKRILHAKKIFMTKISWNIITMIWLDISRVLIICLNQAIALLLQENENGERSEVQFIQTFNLNLQRPGVPAAVEILGKNILLGDENGSFHLLQYHKSNEVVKKFDNIHKDGCTSLLYHESKLFSSGRDGQVRCFDVQIEKESYLIEDIVSLYSISMNFEWTVGVYANMGQMLCCGFQKEDFVVYSMDEKRTLVKIPCGGGGNRKWDFKFGHGKDASRNASFSFVKDKEVYYTFLPMEGHLHTTIKDGLHSRTINCAIQLRSFDNKFDFITGSEDGSLKWFQWDAVNQSILSVDSMENHVSSIRTVWKITNESNQIFLFTGGGRSQLCIYQIDIIHGRLQLLKEIILVKTKFKQTEGDVRIMDIFVLNRGDNLFCCFSACSDGIVRVLYFNTKTNKFQIAGLLSGNAHAVMRINLLKTDSSNDRVRLIGVTSNGYFMLWTWEHPSEEMANICDKKVLPEKTADFQTLLRRTAFLSMKAQVLLAQIRNGEHSYIVACGADDCSIGLWTLTLNITQNEIVDYVIKENWTRDYCQRGAVVGVEIEHNCIYTLSNDQIVATWDINGILKSRIYAGVTDCQGFVVDDKSDCIMAFGKGIAWVPKTSIDNVSSKT